MISPYVKKDPTAFCSYEDHLTAVRTITDFCMLRAESVRGQLSGTIPSTIRGQQEDTEAEWTRPEVWLPDMGEIADLRSESWICRKPEDEQIGRKTAKGF